MFKVMSTKSFKKRIKEAEAKGKYIGAYKLLELLSQKDKIFFGPCKVTDCSHVINCAFISMEKQDEPCLSIGNDKRVGVKEEL